MYVCMYVSMYVCMYVCIRSVIILIGLPLRARPILLITRMITDRIGLHSSVLLPLLILFESLLFFPKNCSLRRRHNPISVSNVCEAAPRFPVLGPQRTQRITASAFQISFHPDWQIHNSFFQRANHGSFSNPNTQVEA